MPDNDDPYLVPKPDPNREELKNPRVKQFLDRISQSEGADYNTLVGGRKISDLSRHPNIVGLRTSAGPSTAFGRYQITGTTDKSKLAKYKGFDYSPENQDLRAVELLRQTGALDALNAGDDATAIKRAGREWASIPGSPLPGRKNTRAFQSTQDPYLVPKATPPPQPANDPYLVPKPGQDLVVAPGRGKQGPMVVRRRAAEAANPQVTNFDPAQPSNAIPSFDEFQKQPTQPQSPYAGVRGGVTRQPRPSITSGVGLVPGVGIASRMRTRPKPAPSSDRMAGAGVSGATRSNVEALMSSPEANPFGSAPNPERDAANKAEAQKEYNRLLTVNASGVAKAKEEARKEIQNQGGWTPETDKWLAETFSRGESHFNELLAGGVRPFSTRKFNQLWARAEGIRQAVEEESQGRSAASKWAQGTLAGLASPEMAAAALHVPPEIAFGGGAGLSSLGRGESPTQAANATRQGAVEGALFRGPALGGNMATRALTKGGTVGAGTYVLTGDPAAAASNAVFAASGPILHGEGAPRTRAPEAEPLVPESTQSRLRMGEIRDQAAQQGAELLNPAEVVAGAKPKVRLRHVDVQRRLDDGTFGKETKAETAARQEQVAATEAPPGTQERPNAPLIKSAGEVPIPPPDKAASTQSPSAATATPPFKTAEEARSYIDQLPEPERQKWNAAADKAKPFGDEWLPFVNEHFAPKPPFEPESKPSRLAQGVEAKAIAAKLTEGFKDLPEYKTVNVKDQAQKATQLLDSDPELAKRIAIGQEMPKGDLLPESVFTAVENRALANGDVQTIEDLARGSRSVEASGMGQRIRMLGERNPHSAVAAIASIEKARSASVPKEKVAQVMNKIKTEVTVEMKKTAPKIDAWQKFLDEVMCK